jgi:poly(A) polymerase
LLSGGDAAAIRDWTRPRLPMSGGQLVAKGLKAGPEVAKTLRAIEDRWIAEQFPDAARVAVITDEEVAQALDATR